MNDLQGRIEVIVGSMFSGKSEELIRRVRRAQIARLRVQVFKPVIDSRSGRQQIASHNGARIEAIPIAHSRELSEHLDPDATVVAIDEVQFLDDGIVGIAQHLADRGIRVIAAGLDMDFRGEPFGPVPQLLAQAEAVDKLQAICMVCGVPASRTQRIINGQPAHYTDPVIFVGAQEVYEARCREHHVVPGKPSTGNWERGTGNRQR
ncbi:MAG: thymidine kinase [Armatimonadetes bacterium]|nr:thymidine kinase [Armatimonadota bacterium]MBI2200992.1 thymidine kinase [Armatimonadota bacterium]